MRIKTLLLAIVLSLSVAPANSGEASLDWLAGHWCSDDDGQRIDEVWLAPLGGRLLGMARTVKNARATAFEFMRIEDDMQGARLYAQPNGIAPTEFKQAARGPDWIQFENAAHDFPNRIEYRRQGDALHAWIAGPDGRGETLKISFAYQRCIN